MMLLSLAQLAHLLHKGRIGSSRLHAADMINSLSQEKRVRIARLAVCAAMLLFIIVMLVEDAIHLAVVPSYNHGAHSRNSHTRKRSPAA